MRQVRQRLEEGWVSLESNEVWAMGSIKRALLCVYLGLLSAPFSTPLSAHADDAGVAAAGDSKNKGDEAFRKATDRLKAKDPNERAAAANEMGRRGYRFRREIAELLRPLLRSDPEPVVRAAAGRALGRLGVREAVPDLVAALGDASADVRVVAAAALWRLPDPSATAPLLEHVKDADKAVREWSALALGVIGDKRAVPEMVRLLGDPERSVRLAAVRSLGRIGDPEGLEPVTKYLRTGKRDTEERDEGIAAIVSIKGDRGPALLSLLEAAEDAEQQVRVIVALGKVGTTQVLPALRKKATGGSAGEVRDAANRAIAEIAGRAKSEKSGEKGTGDGKQAGVDKAPAGADAAALK
jgi:HEAT repeat protein